MKNAFKNFLANKDYSELKPLWNEYANDQYMEGYIYAGVEDYCDMYDPKAADVARMVFFGNVQNWGDDVYLDGYGNFGSCWSVESSPIDLDVLAEWLEDEDHSVFEEWKDDLQPFDEWLNDSYSRSDLLAMWEAYTGEDVEGFDLGVLAESIEDCDGDEYLAYLKEVEE